MVGFARLNMEACIPKHQRYYELFWDCNKILSKFFFIEDPTQIWPATMLLHHPFMQKEFPTSLMFNLF